MASIVLTGGGTAGHVTPHLAILPYLKNDFKKIYYIGSENGIEKNIITAEDIPYYSVPTTKLVRKATLKNFSIPFKLIKGIKQAGKILDEIKPDVVFSKGGYVALPVVIAASKRKIPIFSHESDYSVGLANKLSSRYCKKVFTSFPETAKTLKNGLFTGSPIRKGIKNINSSVKTSFFKFKNEKPVVLITGGSQGAQYINKIVRECLPELTKKFNVIHLCGKGNLCDCDSKSYFQAEYLSDIEKAFAVADVCVTRAGSNTLFELMSISMPCLLIPLPKGVSRGDQILNAKYFEKLGLASVLYQECLTTNSLLTQINAVYQNKALLKDNFSKHPVKDASRNIARLIADSLR